MDNPTETEDDERPPETEENCEEEPPAKPPPTMFDHFKPGVMGWPDEE